ncbi:hypothetical protein [Streptomyces sp. TRM68416]|nr:hypothetical protein [Streptomyces sp. TRM68416]MBD0841586.1 hypothetical protein [Streptomyces sp. TRM68416]
MMPNRFVARGRSLEGMGASVSDATPRPPLMTQLTAALLTPQRLRWRV